MTVEGFRRPDQPAVRRRFSDTAVEGKVQVPVLLEVPRGNAGTLARDQGLEPAEDAVVRPVRAEAGGQAVDHLAQRINLFDVVGRDVRNEVAPVRHGGDESLSLKGGQCAFDRRGRQGKALGQGADEQFRAGWKASVDHRGPERAVRLFLEGRPGHGDSHIPIVRADA